MSSIIVLDSSDEETDSANKKPRSRANQQQVQSMARVNPVKVPNTIAASKKSVPALPNDNFKIQLPSKRSTPIESPFNDAMPPEKRFRRVKPTTVVGSNDVEWINRQPVVSRNGGVNPTPTAMLNKNLVNPVKNPIRVVKSPVTVGNASRSVLNPARAAGGNPVVLPKAPPNYVRVAWNAKDPKPAAQPVINKIITSSVKESPKTVLSPPVINKNITATVKDSANPMPISPPIFNKNSVTIRRVIVNEERPNTLPTARNSIKVDAPKAPIVNTNSTNIRKLPVATDPLKITLPTPTPSKTVNNSTLRISQVNTTPTTSIRRIVPQSDPPPAQQLPVLKRNTNITAASTPSVVYTNPTAVKRIVTVDLPKTPASPPVISKNYTTVPKKLNNEQSKSSMSMSVITKNHAVRPSDKKAPSPVLSKPPTPIMNRPSGLIVTPVAGTGAAIPTTTAPPAPPNKTLSGRGSLSLTNSNRGAGKSKGVNNRSKAGAPSAEPSMAGVSPFNMFPPSFIGGPPMIYDMDPSGGAFINPAYIPNRPNRSMESPNYPTMSPPVFNINYPSFSGGSITPVASPGAAASPTSNRSTKSPVTSTVTRSSNSTRSPAGFMGMTIDVDQPMAPMSPPVYNMNHPAFNGDPFSFMRGAPPQTIPSPVFSPVRSTRSPIISKAAIENTAPVTSPASPVFHRDLDNFVRNPLSYPRTPNNTATSSTGNGPIFSVDSPVRNRSPTGFFKSPTSTITSPAQSTLSDGSSVSEVPPTTDPKSTNKTGVDKDKGEDKDDDNEEEDVDEEEEEREPLITEFETLLQSCRDADASEDMNRLIESKLVRYYYSVHPDFVKSRGFRKAVVAATDSIKKNPDLVYYHLRPVVEEMKARKKSKAIVMTNDETSAAAAAVAAADEGIEEKVRNRQIRRLNKGLYILTRKIHKLENEDVDLDDENSTYLIVERYKKRACEIYDKICDLTGESKHALRQVKKPITFKDTDYPKFNKVVETFVNRTKEFPDFFDVLRMLEFCNERYKFGLVKEEMTMIAQDAFIKIGKLLQSRRKADLYETVSHFTSDYEDPAANDPALLAKLSENEKNQTSIGSIIDKYAREQLRRKAESAAESANASGDELNNSSDSCDSDEESNEDEEQSNNNNNSSDNKKQKKKSKTKATTNGTHSPDTTPQIVLSSSPPPPPPPPAPASTSTAAFRTSPPHAFASPQASPRPRSLSPQALPPPPQPSQLQPCTTSSLKILSVTSLNDAASGKKTVLLDKPAAVAAVSIDEIVISDEDL